jgi:hypothetical protein
MVPAWWRHRREARRLAPPAVPDAPPASRPPVTEPALEHPPREGL